MAINITSVKNKVRNAINSNAQKAWRAKFESNIVEEAADEFIAVLKREIDSCGLDPEVASAIADSIEHDSPTKINSNKYSINVQFSDDMTRPSLNPNDELNNLALLMNDGFSHTKHAVRGIWHGKEIIGLRERDGKHFIESAILQFMNNYARKYGVDEIKKD